MAVSLSKGGNVSLSKEAPGLTEVTVGLGWDPRVTDGTEFDLDASIFIVGENGRSWTKAASFSTTTRSRPTVLSSTWATTAPALAKATTSLL